MGIWARLTMLDRAGRPSLAERSASCTTNGGAKKPRFTFQMTNGFDDRDVSTLVHPPSVGQPSIACSHRNRMMVARRNVSVEQGDQRLFNGLYLNCNWYSDNFPAPKDDGRSR